jgi:hypothetical protein
MFDDLQDYFAGKTYPTADDMNTLRDAVRFLRNFFGANVLNDPDGLAFRKPPRYRDVQLIRVGNTLDGQGKFDAWTLLPTTNRAGLGFTNNVSLTDLFDDNEKVVFWDARDNAASPTSPSGTNRLHSFAGEFIPAIRVPFTEGTGTNSRRVFAAATGGGGSSGGAELLYVVAPVTSRTGAYYVQVCAEPDDGVSDAIDFNVINGAGSGAWTYNDTTNGASVMLNPYEINGAGTTLDLTSMTAEERTWVGVRKGMFYRNDTSESVPYYFGEPLQFRIDCDV